MSAEPGRPQASSHHSTQHEGVPETAAPKRDGFVASNKAAWNDSAQHHKDGATWPALLAGVAKVDFSCFDATLTSLLHDVGIQHQKLIQIGCNNGRECLSLMGLGAGSVCGVDQSAAFLAQARELIAVSPHAVELVEADVYKLPVALHGRFDVALITIGVLNWMPDLARFFACVGATLRFGGRLVIYETHPFLEMFEPEGRDPFELAHSYFRAEPFVDEQVIAYEGPSETRAAPSYWFTHRLSDIFTAVMAAQLQVAHFKEYPHSNREASFDKFQNQAAQLPLCYTLTAIKR